MHMISCGLIFGILYYKIHNAKEESFSLGLECLKIGLMIVFFLWNIYISYTFKKSINSISKIEGYLASEENSLDDLMIGKNKNQNEN